jgi:lysozyme family protein
MVSFTLAWETVRDRQGRVVTERDPRDPGGATRYGIDQRSHPEVRVDELGEVEARAIYWRCYWQKSHAGSLPFPLGEAVFDVSVLQGVGTALRLLQRAVGVQADGRLGPVTRAALERVGTERATQQFLHRAAERLSNLATVQPRLAVFKRGWLRRVRALENFLAMLPKPPSTPTSNEGAVRSEPSLWQSGDDPTRIGNEP